MTYNRQVIPLVESKKMLNFLILGNYDTDYFTISNDIIQKILEIYLYNVKSKFVINLQIFHPLWLDFIMENNPDLITSCTIFNYSTLKIPSYMKYFYFNGSVSISCQEKLYTENHFVEKRLSLKELINCRCCSVHQKKNISFENNMLICHPINGMNQNKKPRCSCSCRNQLRWIFRMLSCIIELQKLYKIKHQRRVQSCIIIQRFYREHLC